MRVSADHRSASFIEPVEAYRQAADTFVRLAGESEKIKSVVVCGSLAKDDVVPGWSDLDIICIPDTATPPAEAMSLIKEFLDAVTVDFAAGVGIDVAFPQELALTSRICGRPLAMTYEVAQYGERYLADAFDTVQPANTVMSTIHRERLPLALAELHNWRRVHLTASGGPAEWSYAAARSALKLLKIMVAPYFGGTFTHQNDLDHLPAAMDPGLRALFEAAVRTRKQRGGDHLELQQGLLRLDATHLHRAMDHAAL